MGPYMQHEGDIIAGKFTNGEDIDSPEGKCSNAGEDDGEEQIGQENQNQKGRKINTSLYDNNVASIPSKDGNNSAKTTRDYKQRNFERGKKKRIQVQEKNERQVRTPDSRGLDNAYDTDDSKYDSTNDSWGESSDESTDDSTDSSDFDSSSDDCDSSSYSSDESEDMTQYSDSDEDSECDDVDTFSDKEQESCVTEESEDSFVGSESFRHNPEKTSSTDRHEGGEDFNKSVHYNDKQGGMNFCLMNNYSYAEELATEDKVAGSTAGVDGNKKAACSKKDEISGIALNQSKGCGQDSNEKLSKNNDVVNIYEQPTVCCLFRPSQPTVDYQCSKEEIKEENVEECKVTTSNNDVSYKHQDVDAKGESANIVGHDDAKCKDRLTTDEIADHGNINDGDELGSGYEGWHCLQYSCLGFSPNKAIEMEEALKGRLQQKLKETPPNVKVEKWNARYEKKELLKEKLARMSPKQARAFKKKLQKAKLMKLKEKEKLAIKKKTDRDLRMKKKLIRDEQYASKHKKSIGNDGRPSRSRQNVSKELQPRQKQYVSKELQAKQQQYVVEQELKRRRKKKQAEELSCRKNDEVGKLVKKEIKKRSGRKDDAVNREKKTRGKPKRRSKKNLF